MYTPTCTLQCFTLLVQYLCDVIQVRKEFLWGLPEYSNFVTSRLLAVMCIKWGFVFCDFPSRLSGVTLIRHFLCDTLLIIA